MPVEKLGLVTAREKGGEKEKMRRKSGWQEDGREGRKEEILACILFTFPCQRPRQAVTPLKKSVWPY